MTRYILRRVLLMIPVAILVTIINFGLLRLAPGDPVLTYAGEVRDPEILNEMRHQLGLDQPLPVQYLAWAQHAVQGDLGRSIRTHQEVTEAIFERVPATLELTVTALMFSISIGLLVGIPVRAASQFGTGPAGHEPGRSLAFRFRTFSSG